MRTSILPPDPEGERRQPQDEVVETLERRILITCDDHQLQEAESIPVQALAREHV